MTKTGENLTGWIETETNHSLTLRTVAGKEEVILRSRIASLTSTGKSVMPDGLEQTISQTAMMDLIAYLKSGLK